MKIFRKFFFLFTIVAAVACNNQPSKKIEPIPQVEKKLPSDMAKSKHQNKPEKIEIMPCKYIVTEILKTSPRYKQLTKGLTEAILKNGGLSFGVNLDGSPFPKTDSVCCYSSNYDYSVYESYTDRQLNIARFSFNPASKQLYEYDVVQDQLKPIEFDRSLLNKYNSLCK